MSERGNALFLILIAVALFAALSYAITQSGRGGGNASKETNAVYAGQIMQIGDDLKVGVQRMILSGTPSTSIVTNTPSSNGYAGQGTLNGEANFCTTGVACLFAPEGGGVTVPQVPRNAFLPAPTPEVTAWSITSYFAGAGSYNGFEINGLSPGATGADAAMPGVGTAANDDMVRIFPLTASVCKAINQGLGFGSVIFTWSTGAPSGTESACVNWGSDGVTYIYYQVLVAN
jgi:hypothetical protein